jgi:hypothetical protein
MTNRFPVVRGGGVGDSGHQMDVMSSHLLMLIEPLLFNYEKKPGVEPGSFQCACRSQET